jgi:hypothetical protein
VDREDPGVDVTGISDSSPFAYANGATVYYGVGSGGFTVQVHVTDSPAGLDRITFPTTTSGGGNYDYTGQTGVNRSHVYSFDSSDSYNGSATVTAEDRAENEGSRAFWVWRDAVAPSVNVDAEADSGKVPNAASGTTTWWCPGARRSA